MRPYAGRTRPAGVPEVPVLLRLLGLLLVVWLVVTVVGWVVKGLFWLTVVGLGLFLLTAALGMRKRIRP
ncbi:hypothetical protein [Geodermatophilus sp. URMC 62]|uniref:hypothetical protein n=1 Tax=Geodermatophilus sp. URMC 62 TaxID=3423414 RepID=UPI00406C2AD0